MATLEGLQFEMERRVILFKPTTTMPDLSQLGYNADPNLIVSPSTPGEQLLYFSPNNTRYVNYDPSGNTIQEWYKKAQPNGWLPLGGASPYGTDSSTWQLNMANNGVILEDSSSNLVIKSYDGSLGTLIVGNLVIDNITGYLRAIDGSIFADPSIGALLSGSGILPGDGNTKDFVIVHNINSLNHLISIYDENNDIVYAEIRIGENEDDIGFSTPPLNGEDHRAVILGF
jgi:hypothetical protein